MNKGLLTVDPHRRLTMLELRTHPWVQGQHSKLYSSTPLMTPDVLSSLSPPKAAENALKATFDAFHMATREGFRLLDVSAAPLAQRRKLKKSSDAQSCSSISSNSSCDYSSTSGRTSSSSSCFSTVSTPTKTCDSIQSLGFVPTRDDSQAGVTVFTYSDTKVTAYLSTLPSQKTDTTARACTATTTDSNLFGSPAVSSEVTIGPTTRSRKRKLENRERSNSDEDCIVIEEHSPPLVKKMKKAPIETIVID